MLTTIASIADKHPDFIKYQHDSIKRSISGEWEHIVFNNGKDGKIRDIINTTCNTLNIKCIELNCNYSAHGSDIQGEAMNKAWNEYLKDRPGCLLWIDIDMFFISPINIEKIAENYDIGYVPIYRRNFETECMWAGITFFNLEKVEKDINFSLGIVNDTQTDAGGMTYHYLKNHPDYKRLYFAADMFYEYEEDRIVTALNGCSGYIAFSGNTPDRGFMNRIFPHEKEDNNYWEKYRMRFENHKNIITKYHFPKPYIFDLIRLDEADTHFIFHYKSASWDPMYGDGENQYSIDKREALKRLLYEGKIENEI